MTRWIYAAVTALILATALLGTARAATVTLAWDANPPAEGVATYAVQSGGVELWRGAETQASVTLPPGQHILAVVAIGIGTNPDGTKVDLQSDPSEPVRVELKSSPANIRVVVTTTVEVMQ